MRARAPCVRVWGVVSPDKRGARRVPKPPSGVPRPRPAGSPPVRHVAAPDATPRQRAAQLPTQLVASVPSHRRPTRRFQVAAVTILAAGAIAGSFAALSRDPEPAPVDAAAVLDPSATPSQPAWRVLAEQKAAQAAAAAAETARRASEAAAAQEAARNAPPMPNVPSSCDEYSGNRAIGCALVLDAGWGLDQMACLEPLWTKESNWRTESHNSSSGAHGIPQALPGDKMATFGADWETNPVTQIKWGLDYIRKRYATPCDAWSFWQAHHWY